jgi:hypothetical protein
LLPATPAGWAIYRKSDLSVLMAISENLLTNP